MYEKNKRWADKNRAAGLCPCCGRPPAPGFKQCARRIIYKKFSRILNVAAKDGIFVKLPDGKFAIQRNEIDALIGVKEPLTILGSVLDAVKLKEKT